MTRSRRFRAARLALILVALAAGASGLAWSIGQQQTQPSSAPATAPVPVAITLAGRVTDAAHVLSAAEVARLDFALGDFERRTGHQMMVVTAPGLGGADIAAFTRALGNAWGIGRKGVDDGVILLIAPVEHQARIATGNGLRGALSDADCAAIMQQHMVPQFRSGHYGAGILAAVTAIETKLA